MSRYKLVVLTRPAPGREADYNAWYDKVHLPDVLAVPGFEAAERLSLERTVRGDPDGASPYLAIYDVETEDPDGALAALSQAVSSGQMTLSDAMDPQVSAWLYAVRET